jgi:hypothetical protein
MSAKARLFFATTPSIPYDGVLGTFADLSAGWPTIKAKCF